MNDTSGQPSSPKPWLAISVVLALLIVAANLAGYVYYRSLHPKATNVRLPDDKPPVGDVDSPRTSPTPLSELAIEQREAGIRALREANYSAAIRSFEAAMQLDRSVPDAEVLLGVARRLQDSAGNAMEKDEALSGREPESTVAEPNEPRPAPAEPEPRPKKGKSRSIRAAARRRAPRPTPRPTETGILLVSVLPEGLLIEVDERPVELSPARLSLPAGRHSIRLRQGKKVLHEVAVDVLAGETATIEGDFSAPEEPASAPPPASSSLAGDPGLDLVALLDRDSERPAPVAVAAARVPARVERPPTQPASARPGLWVVWPGSIGGAVQRSLGADLEGIDVRVMSRGELKKRLSTERPDAVMAAPAILREHGLAPSLQALSAQGDGSFVAVSLNEPMTLPALAKATIGVVDELGRRRTPIFVGRLLGVSEPPKLRRVGEVEDLLPLLYLSVAGAVLVREADLSILEGRTKRRLFKTRLGRGAGPLAVAFTDGGRGPQVETALLSMPEPTKRALGVDRWRR